MPIQTNEIITYKDVYENILQYIKNKSNNIDSFAENVPLQLKNGGRWTISSNSVTKGVAQNKRGYYWWENFQCYATGQIDDEKLVVVPSAIVETQFYDFLKSKGLYSLPGNEISFKGIMNFYNNIASFLSVKLILVTSSFSQNSCFFYDATNVDYLNISQYGLPNVTYNNEQLTSTVDEMLKTINRTTKIHHAFTSVYYTSSSSSSSSSSCSSSSSSNFIVYMDI